MEQSPKPGEDSSAVPDDQPPIAEEHWRWTFALLIVGVFLVWFAAPLGRYLVAEYSAGGVRWNIDNAREAALTIRFLGAMCFAAGLVERLVIHFQIEKITRS
jgi:hypothetical protein